MDKYPVTLVSINKVDVKFFVELDNQQISKDRYVDLLIDFSNEFLKRENITIGFVNDGKYSLVVLHPKNTENTKSLDTHLDEFAKKVLEFDGQNDKLDHLKNELLANNVNFCIKLCSYVYCAPDSSKTKEILTYQVMEHKKL